MWPLGAGGFSADVKLGKVLNRNIFEPRPPVMRSSSSIIDSHARAAGGDEGDKEVGKAEVGAINALLGNGDVGGEFLGDRRSLGVAGVDRLGAAVGLDAGEEQVAALAVDDALKAERPGVGGDLVGVPSRRAANR